MAEGLQLWTEITMNTVVTVLLDIMEDGGFSTVIIFILMECTTATIQSPVGRVSLQMDGREPLTP